MEKNDPTEVMTTFNSVKELKLFIRQEDEWVQGSIRTMWKIEIPLNIPQIKLRLHGQ